jgi:hypothetical protein
MDSYNLIIFQGADYADSTETGKKSKSDEKGTVTIYMLLYAY